MRRLLKFILNIVIYAAIVGLIVWGLPKYLTKKLGTDYPIAAITSGSMWPALHIGDLVLIEAVKKEDLKIGDIVVWQNSKGPPDGRVNFTIHRVKELRKNTLVTKGDGNFTDDEPVKYEDVIGRTVYRGEKPVRVPYMGYISVWAAKLRAN